MLKRLFNPLAAAAGLVALAASTAAQAQDSESGWTFTATPYLWLATIDGNARYRLPSGPSGSVDVKVETDDLLEALDFGGMVTGEARRGRFALFGDLIYLALSADDSRVKSVTRNFGGPIGRVSVPVTATADTGTSTDVDALVVHAGASYSVIDTPDAVVDLHGGIRWISLETDTNWRLNGSVAGPRRTVALARVGSVETDTDIVNAVAGARGVLRFGSSPWSVPFHVDVGTGDSDLTWQVFGGVGYAFGWGELKAGYRHLAYEQDDDSVVEDFSFTGPTLGATFRF